MAFFKRKEPEKIEIQKGYDLWSAHYAREKNPIKSASDEAVREMLPDLKGKSVVDAGCGTGFFCKYAEEMGAASITGIDFSEGMIAQAIQNCKRTHFIKVEIQNLQLNQSVDVIICALVLGHIQDLQSALFALSLNLKVGGVLILTDFHPVLSEQGQKRTFQSGGKTFEIPHHIHTLEEYGTRLKTLGFTTQEIKDIKWKGVSAVFALKAMKIEA